MGIINKSLPLSASENPLEVLSSKDSEDILGEIVSPNSSNKLPIVQSNMILSSPVVSPGRARPLKSRKTQLEIDVGIQKTLSISPRNRLGKHSLSLGRPKKLGHISETLVKRTKNSASSPLVTRSVAVKRNLQNYFGDSKVSPKFGKRGDSASPRGK